MDANGILLARIDSLLGDLSRARSALASTAIPKALQARIGTALFDEIDALSKGLGNDRDTAAAIKVADPQAGARLKNAWLLLDSAQIKTDKLLAECLAFLSGARMRGSSDAQAELCEIADALIAELCAPLEYLQWKRFSFVDAGESFDGGSGVIRLRFPLENIWNLPIAAHEFGHFLSDKLTVKTGDGFPDLLAKQTNGRKNSTWYYLNEYFADIVATWSLGPAYAFTCFLMRFSPVRAWVENDGFHPPDACRAVVILQTLALMDEEQQLAGPRTRLKEFWELSLTAAGKPTALPPADEEALGAIVEGICGVLKATAPHLRYDTWGRAKAAEQALVSAAPTGEKFPLADLLNGAWRRRLTEGVNPESVNQNFLTLWRRFSE